MAWRDNPLGIVLDGTKNADLAKLKEEGLGFVVVDGATGPWDRNPKLSKVVQDAYDNDLPVVLMFTPYPAMDNYTTLGNIQEHEKMAKGITVNHKIHGYLVNTERWWSGTDYEEYQKGTRPYANIRQATNANISEVTKGILDTMIHYFGTQSKDVKVMVRTSDGFVQAYSQNMTSWIGNYPFYLVDWRYRMPNPDDGGKYTKYVVYGTTKTPVETLAVLREQLPPAEAKNPLVPGNVTPLKFWEFSGRRFVHPAVKDLDGTPTAANFVLFNGDTAALHAFLTFSPQNVPDTTPPPVPTNVNVLLMAGNITVSWQDPQGAEDVVGYTVYRNGLEITRTDNPIKMFYVDEGVGPGTYFYSVDAFDAAGNHSEKTAPVQVTVVDPGDPGDPGDPTDPAPSTFQKRLEAAISAFAQAWLNFNQE